MYRMMNNVKMPSFAAGLCLLLLLLPAGAAAAAQSERSRQVSTRDAGDVVVVLTERFFDAILEAMLSQPHPPTFTFSRERAAGPSSSSGGGGGQDGDGASPPATLRRQCAGEIMLLRETAGKQTAVRFGDDGRIRIPIAFRGSYEAPLVGCLKFEGWAETDLELDFDRARRALVGRVKVGGVQLANVPSLIGGAVTELVQSALDKRVNPIEILRADQLAAQLPGAAAGGVALRLRAREVRHEVIRKELRLRISYEIARAD